MLIKLAPALLLVATTRAAVVDVWYNISYAMANPDGLFERRVVGVNGTWPPPILNVNVNDTVRVTAYNGLDKPTSLHHHGMFFNKTAYYDGAPGVTQCGIPPGQSLTYEIPVTAQWGTYWWHSHVGTHYVDGLRAPFLIHPAKEVHTYDSEYTILLSDWYHEQHEVLGAQFLSPANPTGAEPVPKSAAIYVAQNGTYLPGFNENATITFEAGKTYRLRLINAGALGMFHFYIDGHQMSIIEADGTDTDPYPVDFVTISVAQRYSVLVTAKTTTNVNFGWHANYDPAMFDVVPDDLQLNYTSTISYAPGNPMAPADPVPEFGRTPDQDLVPSIVEPQMKATRNIELGVFFDTFENGVNRAAFNNITYTHPVVPSIFTQLSTGAAANNSVIYGPQTHAYVLEKGEVVNLQVINWDAGNHPFHLHGHKYQIVRVAADVSSDDPALNPPHLENQANPMRRDTIAIPAGGAVNIEFIADNPGTWMFHCHIEWHMESGLAVIFIEAPLESQALLTPPPVMYEHCASLGIPTSGNAVGKSSVLDLSGPLLVLGPFPQVPGFHARGGAAFAGTILAALLGMMAVVWYALGGQLDADEVEEEVRRDLAKGKKEGLVKRGARWGWGKVRK